MLDGINEAGLSTEFLWFTEAKYNEAAKGDKNWLAVTDLGHWILGNFATVDEVRRAIMKIKVIGVYVPQLKQIPGFHAAVHDAKGNSIVIEFTDGKTKVFDNPTGVMTNKPTFDWQLTNLRNYINYIPLCEKVISYQLFLGDYVMFLMKNISLSIQAALILILLLMPHPLYAAAGDTLRVTKPDVNVRERPDIASRVTLKVQKDTVVTERSRQGEWVSVEVPGNNHKGWIHAKLLVRVPERSVPAGEKAPALPVKGDAPSSTPIAASERSPQHKGAPMTTAAGSPLLNQPATKIGVVYLQRIINESVEGKKTRKYYAELAASAGAEDLKKIELRLVRQVIEKIETIIAQYARREGFTHVVDAPESGFVFTDERFDITDTI